MSQQEEFLAVEAGVGSMAASEEMDGGELSDEALESVAGGVAQEPAGNMPPSPAKSPAAKLPNNFAQSDQLPKGARPTTGGSGARPTTTTASPPVVNPSVRDSLLAVPVNPLPVNPSRPLGGP